MLGDSRIMKRWLAAMVFTTATLGFVAAPVVAQGKKDQESAIRRVQGKVLDGNDAPVKDAVVYMKNLRTLAIKTLISDQQGRYTFMELSPNVDYQVWAESNGAKSSTKTVSSFDSRPQFDIDLKLKQQ